MYITQSAKELAKYEAIAQKALSDLPAQIHAKLVKTDEYTLSFKLYFGDYPTNFWINDDGKFIYIEKDFDIYLPVKPADLLKEFNGFLRDCLENPD